MDEIKKSVDESWKDLANKEKQDPSSGDTEQEFNQPITFAGFIMSLSLQTLVALGEIDNPISGKKEGSPQQAKIIIDTLDMIREKTKNNLTSEEADYIENILYELKMKYVTKQK